MPITEELKIILHRLWSDKGIQKCMERSNEFQLMDSAKYFLSKVSFEKQFSKISVANCANIFFFQIDPIMDANYKPSLEDILRSRKRTKGFSDIKFVISVSIEIAIFSLCFQNIGTNFNLQNFRIWPSISLMWEGKELNGENGWLTLITLMPWFLLHLWQNMTR